MVAGLHQAADLRQVAVHHVDVDAGHHQRGAEIPARADRAEQIGPAVALVFGLARPAATLGPNPGQGALLADPSLVLPPELDRPAAPGFRDRARDQLGEVFLCAATASASCWG